MTELTELMKPTIGVPVVYEENTTEEILKVGRMNCWSDKGYQRKLFLQDL